MNENEFEHEEESHAHTPQGVPDALGESDSFMEFQERLSRAAHVERPVILIGERGSGKELAASRLHYLSKRWQGPLVALNCAALAPTLIESELFGHEAGAFTGAVRRRSGRFEQAEEGTLFLDEIALIPLEVQEKILRVVEYGVFERVGGSQPIQANVRVIAATNADPNLLAKQGRFKQDLLDRLSFEVLFLPPLRERQGDIMLLTEHFASRMAFELGRESLPEFTEEVTDALLKYNWPGNIRELKNVVERAVYRADGDAIEQLDFNPFAAPFKMSLETVGRREQPQLDRQTAASRGTKPAASVPLAASSEVFEPADLESSRGATSPLGPYEETIRNVEVSMLSRALRQAKFSQKKAAELLKMSYHQFRWLRRKYKDELQEP
jgi:psp operon transcriptional activator